MANRLDVLGPLAYFGTDPVGETAVIRCQHCGYDRIDTEHRAEQLYINDPICCEPVIPDETTPLHDGFPVEWFEQRGMEPTPDGRVQVSVYAVDRRYGGHEEGGWWYDWHEFTGVSERVSIDDIEAARKRLGNLFRDEQPRYPISSVCSDGPEYRISIETKAGENATKERPHYA